jgi:translation elongation factor EF-1alpha
MEKESAAKKPIGVVSNYFEHINVAAIKIDAPIKVGDKLRFLGGDTDFEQQVTSMQIQHKQVTSAKKGDEVGMKVNDKVRKDYKVFKV